MNKFQAMMVGLMLTATVSTAHAGGILTNTNQSIDFQGILRAMQPLALMACIRILPALLLCPRVST